VYYQFDWYKTSAHGFPAAWFWSLVDTAPNNVEVDLMEHWTESAGDLDGTNTSWTVCDPGGCSPGSGRGSGVLVPPGNSEWHTYGVLWQGDGRTGTLDFYSDNQHVGGPPPVREWTCPTSKGRRACSGSSAPASAHPFTSTG
jgi:hypothetical protein